MADSGTHILRDRARIVLRAGSAYRRIYELFDEQVDTHRLAAPPYAISELRGIFREECPGTKSVLDMTAHVGHDTAFFLLTWPGLRITACELDADNAAMLKSNMKTADANGVIPSGSQINIQSGDAVAYIASKEGSKERVDFVYVDAPWERHGKQVSESQMKLGDLASVAHRVFEGGISERVVFKVPSVHAISELITRTMQWSDYRCKFTVRSASRKKPVCSTIVCYYLVFVTRL